MHGSLGELTPHKQLTMKQLKTTQRDDSLLEPHEGVHLVDQVLLKLCGCSPGLQDLHWVCVCVVTGHSLLDTGHKWRTYRQLGGDPYEHIDLDNIQHDAQRDTLHVHTAAHSRCVCESKCPASLAIPLRTAAYLNEDVGPSISPNGAALCREAVPKVDAVVVVGNMNALLCTHLTHATTVSLCVHIQGQTHTYLFVRLEVGRPGSASRGGGYCGIVLVDVLEPLTALAGGRKLGEHIPGGCCISARHI